MKIPHIISVLLTLFVTSGLKAATVGDKNTSDSPAQTMVSDNPEYSGANAGKDNVTPDIYRKLKFVWGAEVNSGVDLSSHDMSTLGIDAMFGMQWQWIRFFGIGAQADVMVSNSSRAFPLTVNFRTDFSQRRRLVFADLRGGVALCYFDHERNETAPYVSLGVGVTLAKGRTFSSHVIVGYTWLGQKECYIGDLLRDCPGVSYANVRLGVCF